MTERLYLADAYLTIANARIVERLHLPPDARLAVVLDRTIFAPPVAGGAADRGTLNDVQITDVFEDEKGRLLHVLPQDTWRDDVQCRLDWPRRFDAMQHHTAQHILSEALAQVCGAETLAAAITPQTAWIEVNKQLSEADLGQVEAWANQVIAAARPVRVAMVDPSQLASLPGLSPTYTPANGQPVRVFNIEGLRLSICQAPHVARTSELGLLHLGRATRSGERLRLEFQCGLRIYDELRRYNQLLTRLAALVGAQPAGLEQAITTLKAQAEQVLEAEAIALVATAERVGNMRVVNRVFVDRDAVETRQLVRKLSEQPGLVILIGTAGARAQLFFARSADLSHDMSVLVKAVAPVIGAQGGGQPRLAESVPGQADVARVEAALSKAQKLLLAKR